MLTLNILLNPLPFHKKTCSKLSSELTAFNRCHSFRIHCWIHSEATLSKESSSYDGAWQDHDGGHFQPNMGLTQLVIFTLWLPSPSFLLWHLRVYLPTFLPSFPFFPDTGPTSPSGFLLHQFLLHCSCCFSMYLLLWLIFKIFFLFFLNILMCRHIWFYSVPLYCTWQDSCFLQIGNLWQHALSKSVCTIFPTILFLINAVS